MHIEPLGERMLVLHFGTRIDPALNAQVHRAAGAIAAAGLDGVIDLVPAYASLAVHYDPLRWVDLSTSAGAAAAPWQRLCTCLERVLADAATRTDSTAERGTIEIPVCYDAAFGEDLDAVAAHSGLSRTALIDRHTRPLYQVAMLGFAPGFPYLLGLDPTLQMPRRATPRTRVPAGSVAIGGAQTGIYPAELPGGWQLIGCTPLDLFDPSRTPPARLAPGDRVRFLAIDAATFKAAQRAAAT